MKMDISTFSQSSLTPSSIQGSTLAILEEILTIKWPNPSHQFRELDLADEEIQRKLRSTYQDYIKAPNEKNRIRLLQALQTKIAAVKNEYEHAVVQQQYYGNQAARESQDTSNISWGEWLIRGAQRITGYDSLQQQTYYESIAKDRLEKLESLTDNWQQLYKEQINEEHIKTNKQEKIELKEAEIIELNADSYKEETENNKVKTMRQNRYLSKKQLLSSTTTLTPAQFPADIQLSSLNGQNGFTINGENNQDYSGISVSAAGDFNGDGYADLLIGAELYDGRVGRSYVVFGGPGVGSGGIVSLSNLNGTNGFKLDGENSYDYSGCAVSTAGDINSDGYADLIIGASGYNSNKGRSYVMFGGPGVGTGGVLSLSSLNGTNGFKLDGEGGYSGIAVSGVGDINGDGHVDLLIGANYYNTIGRSYVVFGGPGLGNGGIVSLSNLNGTNGFKLDGEITDFYSYCGYSVSGVGDINGDGHADIIIGAPGYNSSIGRSYVVFGRPGVGSSGNIALASLNGTDGFKLDGENIESGQSGISVSGAGDINGDGYADLLIGMVSGGRSYAVFGGPEVGNGGVVSLSSLNGTNGFKLDGENNSSGESVSGAGDINGDGVADLVVGSPSYHNIGRSYVVFGGLGVGNGGVISLSSLNGTNGFKLVGENNSATGYSVCEVGDINGDGYADLLIGAPYYSAGYSYLVFGDSAISPPSVNCLIINQSQALIVTDQNLNISDTNHPAASLSFVITNLQHGQFSLVAVPDQAITQFSYLQVSTNQVQFNHDGSPMAPNYTVQVQGKTFAISPAQNANVTFYSQLITPTSTPSSSPLIPTSTPSSSSLIPTSTPSSSSEFPTDSPSPTSAPSDALPVLLIAEIAGGALAAGALLISLCCLYRCFKKNRAANPSENEIKMNYLPASQSPPSSQNFYQPVEYLDSSRQSSGAPPYLLPQGVLVQSGQRLSTPSPVSSQRREDSVPLSPSSLSRPSQATLSGSRLPLTVSLSRSGKLDSEVVRELKVSRRSASPSSPKLMDEAGDMKISFALSYQDLEFDEKDKLGSGAYGTVYKGTYKFNDVAVKKLHVDHLSEGAVEELKQEAGILGSMRSDYIVRLNGVCLEEPNFCLVMELMPKGSLYNVLQNSPGELPLSVRYRIGLDVCYGLYHLHEVNILHRDLKSLNVLLDDRFRAKITDFGLSKMKSEMGSMGSSKGMKGTLGWMAPELFAEKPEATTAADIYAYGMVLFELMANPYRIPFQGLAPASVITAKLTRGDKQETISESCPPKMAQLMRACWQEPEKRPPAKALAKSLSALFKASQSQQEPPKVAPVPHLDPLKSEVPGYGQNLASFS